MAKQEHEQEQPFSPLVGAVLTQMMTDRAATQQALDENYQWQIKTLTAELAAIREGVRGLLDGPYAPSTLAIERAVWFPRKDFIDKHMTDPAF